MDTATITKIAFAIQVVIYNFNADGFTSLCPMYKCGRPPKFTLAQRREIEIKIKPLEPLRPSAHFL